MDLMLFQHPKLFIQRFANEVLGRLHGQLKFGISFMAKLTHPDHVGFSLTQDDAIHSLTLHFLATQSSCAAVRIAA